MEKFLSSISSSTTDDEFSKSLKSLSRKQLNRIDIQQVPQHLRKFVDQERCRRKTSSNTPAQILIMAPIPTTNKPKQKKKKSPASVPTHSMFPNLHPLVSASFPTSICFHTTDSDSNTTETWDTNVIGSFTCSNTTCSKKGWNSWVVPITIRLYPNNKYNVRVYHQRCKKCNTLADQPELDEDVYVERVVRRLRIWMGYPIEEIEREDGSKGPHDRKRCEGCNVGHCTWAARNSY